MSSVTDSNGYCNITASGDIKATGSAAALEFVKITNATDDDLNGVWQIITYSSDTSFVLNIPYSSANDTALTGASIQYYYNNYVVKVQIWGGLNNGHVYYAQKPFDLLATLDLIPDDSNVCMFSISEILKKQIEIENNLLLSTLPNNLDAFTSFFIKFGEEYDDSDGTTLSRSTVSYTSDLATFEGKAVNSILPFKNVYSGAMTEYASSDTGQKFLTNWERPTIFSGKYFDLGFINDGLYDTFLNPALSTFINQGSGTAWTTGATPSVTLADGASSQILSKSFSRVFKSGVTYRVAVSITYSGASTTVLTASIESASNTNVNFIQTFLINGTNIFTVDLTASGDYYYLVFRAVDTAGGGGGSYTLNGYWVYPINDPDYGALVLNEDSEVTVISTNNEGVYRIPLSDPDCANSEVDVSISEHLLIPIDPTGSWTGASGYDSSGFSLSFTEALTSGEGVIEAYQPISIPSGKTLRITVTVTISGTWTGASLGVLVSMFLTTSGAVLSSDSSLTTDPVSFLVNGTYTIHFIVRSTGTSARMYLRLTELTISSGTANVTLTLPTHYYVSNTTGGSAISETKTLDINCKCVPSQAEEGIYLSWQNNEGHFDYWFFTAYKDHITDIVDSGETSVNTFPNWPASRGEFADTDKKKQTYRESFPQILVRSQHLTKDQLNQIKAIKTSPLVQIVNSIYDRRTVIVDTDSFTEYKEDQKLYEITFTITYTDDVPSQRV